MPAINFKKKYRPKPPRRLPPPSGPKNPVYTTPKPPTPPPGFVRPSPPRPPMPVLPGSQGMRIAADEAYNLAQSGHNTDLYQAALNYGDLGLINQLAGLGFGQSLQAAPEFGELAGIERGRTQGRKDVGRSRNAGNTFFSSLHATDLSDIDLASQNARAEALQRYETAKNNLAEMLANALITKNQAYADADQMDFDYANSLPPEEGSYDFPAPPNTPASGGGGKKGGGKKGGSPSYSDGGPFAWGKRNKFRKGWGRR